MNRGLHPEAASTWRWTGPCPRRNATTSTCTWLPALLRGACGRGATGARKVGRTALGRATRSQGRGKGHDRALPTPFAWFRSRRGVFRFEFALAGLLLIGGVAGPASGGYTGHPRTSVASGAIRRSPGSFIRPQSGEPHLIVEPNPLSGEPALQRPARAQPSAAALFAQALALRGEGKVDAAIAPTCGCNGLYPAARETWLSFALAGRLLLDRGSSEQALAQFNQYLARPGDVAEEALVDARRPSGVLAVPPPKLRPGGR